MSFSESEAKAIDEEAYLIGAHKDLGEVERVVLADVAQRILMGQGSYGKFKRDDPRNFTKEALAEMYDGVVYLAVQLKGIAMGQKPKPKRKRAKK